MYVGYPATHFSESYEGSNEIKFKKKKRKKKKKKKTAYGILRDFDLYHKWEKARICIVHRSDPDLAAYIFSSAGVSRLVYHKRGMMVSWKKVGMQIFSGENREKLVIKLETGQGKLRGHTYLPACLPDCLLVVPRGMRMKSGDERGGNACKYIL